MKLVTAIIQPHRVDEVRAALEAAGVKGVTVSEAAGYGPQCRVDFLVIGRSQIDCASRVLEFLFGKKFLHRIQRRRNLGQGKFINQEHGLFHPQEQDQGGNLGTLVIFQLLHQGDQ